MPSRDLAQCCRAALALALCVVPLAAQQRPAPHLGFAYPAGGRQGSTFTVSVGGQNLAGAHAFYCSEPGITARVASYERPLTQKEINDLREKAQELQEKRTAATKREMKPDGVVVIFTPEDEKMLGEIRQKLATRPTRQANPAIGETVTLEVTVLPTAAVGSHEFRLRGSAGLSNPITFCVDSLPEFTDPVVIATTNPAPRGKRGSYPNSSRIRHPAQVVNTPVVINGQILPGEEDRYVFTAKQGQRFVAAVRARALLPYLADAVPGWFQATLALRDSAGNEVAYADDNRFDPDPVLTCVIPADGEYTLEVKDAIYRGREDFVYRIALGEVPLLTDIFPLGGRAGAVTTFEFAGWNLPARELTLDLKNSRPGSTLAIGLRPPDRGSNRLDVTVGQLPERTEREPNERSGQPASVELPCIVNGRIGVVGGSDVFAFHAGSGEAIVAEITARRLGSPLDSTLEVTDALGQRVAFNDDSEDRGAGLVTHHADSRLTFTAPETGNYFVRVTDAQGHGGTEYAYRLRLSSPQPDFELRVSPSTVNARAGAEVMITVHALRRDGFAGEIALALMDAPAGFSLSGAVIPAGQDRVAITMRLPVQPREEPWRLRLAGVAQISDRRVGHQARPADDLMQAFAYHHLVPAQEFLVLATGRGAAGRIASETPVKFEAGHEATVAFTVPTQRTGDRAVAELREAPEGVSVSRCQLRGTRLEVALRCDPTRFKTGWRGNLILEAFTERENAPGKTTRNSLGLLPALPIAIAPEITSATTVAQATSPHRG